MILTQPKKLRATLSKTADGRHDYLQILSEDQFALNIVLIADKIELSDKRVKEAEGK